MLFLIYVIYIIFCKKCNLFYVGETGAMLKARIQQHLNNILKFKLYQKYHDKEVAKHFRKGNHKLSLFKILVFKSNLEDSKIRKYFELILINRLNINKTSCFKRFTVFKNKKFIFAN